MMQRLSPGVYRGAKGRLVTPRFGAPRGASLMGRPISRPQASAAQKALPTPQGAPQMEQFQRPAANPTFGQQMQTGGGLSAPQLGGQGYQPQPSRYVGDYYGGRSVPSFASGWAQQFQGNPYSMPDGQSEYVMNAQQQVEQKPSDFSRGWGGESSGTEFTGQMPIRDLAQTLQGSPWQRIPQPVRGYGVSAPSPVSQMTKVD